MQLCELPTEILLIICDSLPMPQLCTLMQVSKQMQNICNNAQVWQKFATNLQISQAELQRYNNNIKLYMQQVWPYRFKNSLHFENYEDIWQTAICNKQLVFGHVYRIAFEIVHFKENNNFWNMVFGIVPRDFVTQHGVVGSGGGGFGVALSNGEVLDFGFFRHKDATYIQGKITANDRIGVELDWQSNVPTITFFANQKVIYKCGALEQKECWYFAVSVYIKKNSIRLVAW